MLRPSTRGGARAWLLVASVVASALLGSGCATYSDTIRDAQRDLVYGRPESAVQLINKELETESAKELPKSLDEDKVLLLLERATLLQGLGQYELASRDMIIADQRLEWLDIDDSDDVNLAKYLYSDDATAYRAPAYERLLLNTLNMVNFLAMRDFSGAKVEARRFALIEEFFHDKTGEALLPEVLATGNYLGGVAFEGARDYEMAARYYSRAWHFGLRTPMLRRRLVDLYRVSGYSAREIDPMASGLDVIRREADSAGALRPTEYRRQHVSGQLVVVTQTGLAPYKVPERIPIGLALTYATTHRHHRHHLSTAERARANRFAVEGALKWVNFPVLTHRGLPQGRSTYLFVDGERAPVDQVTSVAAQVQAAWRQLRGPLMAAAITRLITRIVAGQATRIAASKLAESEGARTGAAGALGWLAGLAVEGAMTAADTPDTRSWTTLPATIRIFRKKLTPGSHEIIVRIDGREEKQIVTIRDDRFTVLNFSRYR